MYVSPCCLQHGVDYLDLPSIRHEWLMNTMELSEIVCAKTTERLRSDPAFREHQERPDVCQRGLFTPERGDMDRKASCGQASLSFAKKLQHTRVKHVK